MADAIRPDMRSPRFRRVPFMRDVAQDPGRTTAPRLAAPHVLPSTDENASAPAILSLSWLTPTPHMIAVYASPWSSPSTPQHSLPGGRYPLPGPDFHRLELASFSWRTSPRLSRGTMSTYLELARAAGLPAVRTEVQKFGGVPVIIVERFDRYRDRRDKLVKRIHQEDCCQALGVHPNTKYQSEGGPGLPEIMDLLRSTKSPEVDRDRFMRAQVFNFLIGGTDAHAKNYSIIYEPGGAIRLTPLYDVISFLPYQQRRSRLKLAMTIGGRREVDEIRLRHSERAAERCRYSAERIVAHVRELTATLPGLAANVRIACRKSVYGHPILDLLVDQIADNAVRIAKRN